MQEARWRGEDRHGESGMGAGGFGALGASLLRWAQGCASMHALMAGSRGSCAEEGVTIAERMALLDESDRAVRARARRMLFGGMR